VGSEEINLRQATGADLQLRKLMKKANLKACGNRLP
jgi:hypothetical protein